VLRAKVVAIYENASSITRQDDRFLLGIPAAERYLPPTNGDIRVLVRDADGVPQQEARAAIRKITKADFPQVKILDEQQVINEASKAFNQFLGFFLVLLGLTVIIGLLGIVNTMLLSIHERTRELGLLRAVGMTRRQLGASISMESVIIALLGTSLGILAGLALAASIMSAARNDFQGARLAIPYAGLVLVLVLTVIAGVLAAAWPARRATRLDVLAAISTE
jgi:putative ABC transport system permease protein